MTTELIAQAVDRFGLAAKNYGVALQARPGQTTAEREAYLVAREALITALEAQQAGGEAVGYVKTSTLGNLAQGGQSWLRGNPGTHLDETPVYTHPAPVQQVVAPNEAMQAAWRDLALQFDGHRMQALGWLRLAAEELPRTPAWSALRDFIAAPPLSGAEVLQQRVEALAAQPAAERVPLTEAEFMRLLNKLGPDMHGRIALTYESGPYDIDKPTNVAMRLLRGIEAALGITATSGKEGGNG